MSVSSDTSNSSNISECAICLEEKTGFVAKIDCGHIYHYSCVQSWINKKKIIKNVVVYVKQIPRLYNY